MLTKKQREVFVYIRDFINTEGYSPSQEEVREKFDFSSASTAEFHIKNLCDKRYLKQQKGKARTIEVVQEEYSGKRFKKFLSSAAKVVPILGYANAGDALSVADESNEGFVEVPPSLSRHSNLFALFVDGDSMNMATIGGKKIVHGSIIFIDPDQKQPVENDVVLSIINGHANIKKYCIDSERNLIILRPYSTNNEHKPIFLSMGDDFQVNGKVVGVL